MFLEYIFSCLLWYWNFVGMTWNEASHVYRLEWSASTTKISCKISKLIS